MCRVGGAGVVAGRGMVKVWRGCGGRWGNSKGVVTGGELVSDGRILMILADGGRNSFELG